MIRSQGWLINSYIPSLKPSLNLCLLSNSYIVYDLPLWWNLKPKEEWCRVRENSICRLAFSRSVSIFSRLFISNKAAYQRITHTLLFQLRSSRQYRCGFETASPMETYIRSFLSYSQSCLRWCKKQFRNRLEKASPICQRVYFRVWYPREWYYCHKDTEELRAADW
jgi:hypothetical protein